MIFLLMTFVIIIDGEIYVIEDSDQAVREIPVETNEVKPNEAE